MIARHTPGEWVASPTFRGAETASPGIDIGGPRGENIATVLHDTSDRDPDETRANARLIAAAPELLAALEGILAVANVRIDDPRIGAFDAGRAAIAKALGK